MWIDKLKQAFYDQSGQGLVEYNLVLLLVALLVLIALADIGGFLPGVFSGTSGALQ